MESVLNKVQRLALEHDRIDPEIIRSKNIKMGLRNEDGTGVVAGITSKGQVKGYDKVLQKDGSYKVVPAHGVLCYCGYDVTEIVAHLEAEDRFGFDEITYLLLTGELPKKSDLKSFTAALAKRRSLPEESWRAIMNRGDHDDTMGALHTAVSSLYKFDPNPNSTDIQDVTRQCVELIAKLPTIVAYIYQVGKTKKGVPPTLIPPDETLCTAENFLYMLTGSRPDPFTAHLFDLCLVLHAEHGGGNNSTFTVRAVSSSQANTYMAICSGIASLSGHLHGGANEAVMNMMEDIKKHVKNWNDEDEVYAYVEKILAKKAGDKSGKVYGVGHAVYTLSDPRAVILEKKAEYLAEQTGRLDEFRLYQSVARHAVKIVQEQKKKVVSPNVDFYSGFVYESMGLTQEVYTPIFAVSRVVGWAAHRIEELIQGRLIRPSYVSSLKENPKYVPLKQR